MTALLYLPKSARPPYQTMIYMGGGGSFRPRPSATEEQLAGWSDMEFLLRGGRAVLLPIWKGSYERADGFRDTGSDVAEYREKVLQWIRELRQSIDYLETRSIIDAEKIGWEGASFGAWMAPFFLALEPRLKTGILVGGGFPQVPATMIIPREMDPVNLPPRVKVPVLMLNGRYDPIFPYETAQVPLFEALGTPPSQKKHLTFESGHSTYGWRTEFYAEVIGWLDDLFGLPLR